MKTNTAKNWLSRAACFGMPVAIFFPEQHDTEKVRKAKAICAQCPVSDDCLEEALATPQEDDLFGIYAGTSPKARRRLRGERKEPAGSTVLVFDRVTGKYRRVAQAAGKSASIRLAEPPIE